jgi:hypothetical protein
MKSDARYSLHKKFEDLPVGQHFQIVNSLMGAALPNSHVFKKVTLENWNAVRLDNGEAVTVRAGTLVEVA